jgi:hypothetical protein
MTFSLDEILILASQSLRNQVRELLDYIADLLSCTLGQLEEQECSVSEKLSEKSGSFSSRSAQKSAGSTDDTVFEPWRDLEQ